MPSYPDRARAMRQVSALLITRRMERVRASRKDEMADLAPALNFRG